MGEGSEVHVGPVRTMRENGHQRWTVRGHPLFAQYGRPRCDGRRGEMFGLATRYTEHLRWQPHVTALLWCPPAGRSRCCPFRSNSSLVSDRSSSGAVGDGRSDECDCRADVAAGDPGPDVSGWTAVHAQESGGRECGAEAGGRLLRYFGDRSALGDADGGAGTGDEASR